MSVSKPTPNSPNEIGLVIKMLQSEFDINKDRRKFSSVMGPNSTPKISGAVGIADFFIKYPKKPNTTTV